MNIEVVNNTPFVPLHFESVDARKNHFGVVVVRGSFDIVQGMRLTIAGDQESLILEDTYFEEGAESSLRFDSSLTPYKPRTDLLIEATAHSPSRKPTSDWISQVEFGDKKKSFRVTGPCAWEKVLGRNRLSEPKPIEKLDVRYEYAFGGNFKSGEPYPQNPVGIGCTAISGQRFAQLLPVDFDRPRFGQPVPVVGLGPIGPSWQPRLGFAGTYDDTWEKKHAPYLPPDFDFEFYNVAPNDMKFSGFAKGDEIIKLQNLFSKGNLAFGLPGIQMGSVLRFDDGRIIPGPMNLDTIEVQVEQQKVFLQWRGIFPATLPIRQVELRLSAPEFLVEV